MTDPNRPSQPSAEAGVTPEQLGFAQYTTAESVAELDENRFNVVVSERPGDVVAFDPHIVETDARNSFNPVLQELDGIIQSGEKTYGVLRVTDIRDPRSIDLTSRLLLTEFPDRLDGQSTPVGRIGEAALEGHDFAVQEIGGRVWVANKTGKPLRVISQHESIAQLPTEQRADFQLGYRRAIGSRGGSLLAVSGAWSLRQSDAESVA